MKENEKWILWNPTKIECGSAFSVEIFQEEDATRFTLNCKNGIVDVWFFCLVPIYLYSVEGIRMATWAPVQEKENDRFYFTKWFLYKVENSEFLDWAIKEGCGFYSKEDLTHFCIVTENDVVDILAMGEPLIFMRK